MNKPLITESSPFGRCHRSVGDLQTLLHLDLTEILRKKKKLVVYGVRQGVHLEVGKR